MWFGREGRDAEGRRGKGVIRLGLMKRVVNVGVRCSLSYCGDEGDRMFTTAT